MELFQVLGQIKWSYFHLHTGILLLVFTEMDYVEKML